MTTILRFLLAIFFHYKSINQFSFTFYVNKTAQQTFYVFYFCINTILYMLQLCVTQIQKTSNYFNYENTDMIYRFIEEREQNTVYIYVLLSLSFISVFIFIIKLHCIIIIIQMWWLYKIFATFNHKNFAIYKNKHNYAFVFLIITTRA